MTLSLCAYTPRCRFLPLKTRLAPQTGLFKPIKAVSNASGRAA